MTTIVNTLRKRFDQHQRFRRTLNELNALSDAEAADLGIARADFRRIAHEAVYGA